MKHFVFSGLTLALIAMTPAHAESDQTSTSDKSSPAETGILALLPADSVSEHSLQTETGPLLYTATAGTLSLRGQDGQVTAKIFYTAYRAKDRKPDRPVTFAFNGGPGAASAYLHLGLVGPKILPFTGANEDGTEPRLEDNPESWLQFTDLVLIDPVGTGWSRAVNEEAASRFYGVRQDAESLAKAVSLYVLEHRLLDAPKYLLGESYGGFRAPKVALALKNNQGMLTKGIIMVSPLMEGRFVFQGDDDPLAAALQLPSLVSAHLERSGKFTDQAVTDAEAFAVREFLPGLVDPPTEGQAAATFYSRLSEMTGLNVETVRRARGFVGSAYAKQAAGAGRIVSPYDAGVSVPDAYPEASYSRNDDPVLEGYTRAYAAAFASYARQDLGFKTEMTYSLLNEEVNRKWEWNGNRGSEGRMSASISTDLRDLLSTIPSFRLLVVHGYSDILTPYGASRYVIDHIPETLSKGRTSLKLYRGGHMFYTRDGERKAMYQDAKVFYEPR